MTRYRSIFIALTLTAVTQAFAAPLLFLKGDKLYALNTNYESVYVTNGVTRVVAKTAFFLKEDRLYRIADNGEYDYVTQQVSEVCDDPRFIVKQGSRLYVLDSDYEAYYITSGVTSCRSK